MRDWSASKAFCDDVHQRQRPKSTGTILFHGLVLLSSRQIFLAYKMPFAELDGLVEPIQWTHRALELWFTYSYLPPAIPASRCFDVPENRK